MCFGSQISDGFQKKAADLKQYHFLVSQIQPSPILISILYIKFSSADNQVQHLTSPPSSTSEEHRKSVQRPFEGHSKMTPASSLAANYLLRNLPIDEFPAWAPFPFLREDGVCRVLSSWFPPVFFELFGDTVIHAALSIALMASELLKSLMRLLDLWAGRVDCLLPNGSQFLVQSYSSLTLAHCQCLQANHGLIFRRGSRHTPACPSVNIDFNAFARFAHDWASEVKVFKWHSLNLRLCTAEFIGKLERVRPRHGCWAAGFGWVQSCNAEATGWREISQWLIKRTSAQGTLRLFAELVEEANPGAHIDVLDESEISVQRSSGCSCFGHTQEARPIYRISGGALWQWNKCQGTFLET